jgi:hypothetical protein
MSVHKGTLCQDADTSVDPECFLADILFGNELAVRRYVRDAMAEYNRYETPMAPGSLWPDGSPVSNWSQAVAALARHGSVLFRDDVAPASHQAADHRASAETPVLVLA